MSQLQKEWRTSSTKHTVAKIAGHDMEFRKPRRVNEDKPVPIRPPSAWPDPDEPARPLLQPKKGNSSPFNIGGTTKPTVSQSHRNSSLLPGERTTPLSAVPSQNFYGKQAIETSKYFRAIEDAPADDLNLGSLKTPSHATNSYRNAQAGPSSSPPMSKAVAASGSNRSKARKEKPPPEVIDLIESDEETPEEVEEPRLATSTARREKEAPRGQQERRWKVRSPHDPNSSPISNNSGDHRNGQNFFRKRPRAESADSTTEVIDGGDEEDDAIEDFGPSQLSKRSPSPQRQRKRLMMQDKRGTTEASGLTRAKGPIGSRAIGTVAVHLVGEQIFGHPAQSQDWLYWHAKDGKFHYRKLVWYLKEIVHLVLPSPKGNGPYWLGFVVPENFRNRQLDSHSFEIQTEKSPDTFQKIINAIKAASSAWDTVSVEIVAGEIATKNALSRALAEASDRDTKKAGSGPQASSASLAGNARPKPKRRTIGPNLPPGDVDASASPPQQRSSRRLRNSTTEQSIESEIREARSFVKDPDKVICRWPPEGRAELQINAGDLSRLDEDEFLNDTLIDFGLRYIAADLDANTDPSTPTSQRLRSDDIHVFNPFFYKKISSKAKGVARSSTGDNAAAYPDWPAYESVRKWTNKVDIFQKRFLIIPINENLHWYMAVIHNPGIVLEDPVFLRGTTPPEEPNRRFTRRANKLEEEEIRMQIQASEHANQNGKAPPIFDAEAEDVEMANVEEATNRPRELPVENEHQHEPMQLDELVADDVGDNVVSLLPLNGDTDPAAVRGLIMTFDSLRANHPAVGNTLNRWLAYEAWHKRSTEVSYSNRKKPFEYKAVEVPMQKNFSDCGIYCLHYMAVLLSNPYDMMAFIYKTFLPKQDLNGETLDKAKQWLDESAQHGRRKWRRIIQKLGGLPEDISPPPSPRQSGAAKHTEVAPTSVDGLVEQPTLVLRPEKHVEVKASNPRTFFMALNSQRMDDREDEPSLSSNVKSVTTAPSEEKRDGPIQENVLPEESLSVASSRDFSAEKSNFNGSVGHSLSDTNIQQGGSAHDAGADGTIRLPPTYSPEVDELHEEIELREEGLPEPMQGVEEMQVNLETAQGETSDGTKVDTELQPESQDIVILSGADVSEEFLKLQRAMKDKRGSVPVMDKEHKYTNGATSVMLTSSYTNKDLRNGSSSFSTSTGQAMGKTLVSISEPRQLEQNPTPIKEVLKNFYNRQPPNSGTPRPTKEDALPDQRDADANLSQESFITTAVEKAGQMLPILAAGLNEAISSTFEEGCVDNEIVVVDDSD